MPTIEILSAALEDDYDVCFATSAEEAYDVLRNVIPDLVLLDVIMPGASGYEVCRHIKSDPLLADIPIIFTTALDAEDAQLVGLELGAIDYLTKPISPLIVQAPVRNHLEMKRTRDQLAALAVTDALTGLGNRRQLVAGDAGVDLFHPLTDFGDREVLVAVVDRLELATVDGVDGLGEQAEAAA